MQITLAFAGDIVPTETNEKYFIEGDIVQLFGKELVDYLASVDFRCFNLETPLTNRQNTAWYPGPYLMARPETLTAIKALNPSLLTLGNNHVLDQGEDGFLDTVQALEKSGIAYAGAGINLKAAQSVWSADVKGSRIEIYNCSEYEFAAATATKCGANPYDPLVSFDHVAQMSPKSDLRVVLYHGGKEFYRYPSPQLQRICRKFVDSGADLVICQHSHCIGCEEKYAGKTIVYGQGNFIFDRKENEFKRTGMIVECTVSDDSAITVSYVPFVKQNECIKMADDGQRQDILDGYRIRSREITTPGFIEDAYAKLADESFDNYTRALIGHSGIVRVLNKITGGAFVKRFFSDPRIALRALNIVSTDNHAELFKAGLRKRGSRGNNGH